MGSKAQELLKAMRAEIETELTLFLKEQSQFLANIAEELGPPARSLSSFSLDGGKRLRPLFAFAAYIGAGGKSSPEVTRAIASLELLQACALIHDDLIDGSDTRRGKASIHRHFETLHQNQELAGFATRYGQGAAVLLGDLALVWSDQMLNSSGITTAQLLSVLPVHDEMRVELMAGQFLDIHEQTEKNTSVHRALKIARFKSGKYTVERPLHIGASLAITSLPDRSEINEIYSNYGLPLGEAFQMRDDLLGVFGDSNITGKPAGDDLRESKHTVLIATTFERVSEKQRVFLHENLGKTNLESATIDSIREIITTTGARSYVEDLIEELTDRALAALARASLEETGRALLLELAEIATKRSK